MRGHLEAALAAQALKEATGDHVLLVGGGVGGCISTAHIERTCA